MSPKPLHFIVALCVITIPTLCQAQYRWIDPEGKVTYGDAPPPNAKNIQEVHEARVAEPDPNVELPYALRKAVERFPVTLYTTKDCAPCETARGYLNQRGIPFTEKTVHYKEELAKMKQEGLGTEFPTVQIGGRTLHGFNANAWRLELDASGYPNRSLLPSQWTPKAAQPLMDRPTNQTVPQPTSEQADQ